MKDLKNKKLVNKLLFWFLLIALVPLNIVTSIQYYMVKNSLTKEVDNNLVSIADSKAKFLDFYINEKQKNAAIIAQMSNIIEATEKYQKAFNENGINAREYEQIDKRYRRSITNYLDIFTYSDILLISQSGNTIFSVNNSKEIIGKNYYQENYKNSELAKVFDRAKTLMQVEISNFTYYISNNEPAAFIAAPIFKNNLIIGVVVLQLNNQEFNKVVNDYTGLGKTGEIIVASLVDERIIFTAPTRHDPKAAFQRYINIRNDKSHPLNQANQGIKGNSITIDYRGQETISAWRYLPSLNAGILVKMDVAEVFTPLKTLQNIVILLGIITLILVIVAAIAVAKSISQPVIELTEIVQEFAQGNLKKQASVLSNDEIGQLELSFNRMAAQLKASFETIQEREQELTTAKEQLEKVLAEVQQEAHQLASQLIQSEKMSSLGQLVAGVAHEINNPINFIYGNLTPANEYIQDLLRLLKLYQHHYPHPVKEIEDEAEAIDINFLIKDLPKLLASMGIGAKRITEIVRSLRNFSRLDEAEMKAVNIHEGIDSTLMILENRFKAASNRPAIEVIKNYADLPLVECYTGQLNQVFMNILANAIDALEESKIKNFVGLEKLQIQIYTELINDEQVSIRIIDNGVGIPEKLKKLLFDPFFTTKPIGKGTGLGLSISYKIITEQHQGKLQCISSPGNGTEFIITIPLYQNLKKVN
ncbi:ATP-binding protein [Anabaena sp. PCC 7938]|uniref:histidine kinase n=1 Tax=Anabaena cylindrica (strain ATCC 27899 / PCC 7122) TaxID=272123 RepID=K9ZFM3_ANACC|nr:integral membrane sensor signal transduction histidine kinase [Anabaena cylindrica PCC 7122]BAY05880.1 multi-sensor signal transduction histidine kinase [Anabaena cylindrica PCC 7122]